MLKFHLQIEKKNGYFKMIISNTNEEAVNEIFLFYKFCKS